MPKKKLDTNPDYWDEYTPFQAVKHKLVRNYLNGWYPKLGFWSGRVLYVETHAGRGMHATGDPGSPLVALQTLLSHSARDAMLAKSEFNFLFIEHDSENLASLNTAIGKLGELPSRIAVDTQEEDAFQRISTILDELKRDRKRLAPAFVFVDPYGFKIPTRLLADLMKSGRVELFINVIWRELDMLICQKPAVGCAPARTIDDVFDGGDWREEITGDSADVRLNQAIPLLARATGAKWWTSAVRMVTGGSATRYLLLHLTNNDAGRDLMKECCWKMAPDGDFVARKSDNPDQQFLFEREPDFRPLRSWVLDRLKDRPHKWQELHDAVRPEWWLKTHVNEVVRALKKEGRISADRIPGKSLARSFTIVANPILRLAEK